MGRATTTRRQAFWTAIGGLAMCVGSADCKKETAEGARPTAAGAEASTPPTLQAAAAAAMGTASAAPADGTQAPAPPVSPVLPSPPTTVGEEKPFASPQEQIAALTAQLEGPGAGGGEEPAIDDQTAKVCEAFLARTTECASGGPDDMPMPPEAIAAVQDAAREMCRSWATLGPQAMSAAVKAIASCYELPCGLAGSDWLQCVAGRISDSLVAGLGGAPVPTPPPAPWSGEVPPACVAYADKMFACMTETMGAAVPASVMQESRAALLEGCTSIRDAGPQMAAAFERAMAVCADHRCGEGGSEWVTCFTDALSRAMTEGL